MAVTFESASCIVEDYPASKQIDKPTGTTAGDVLLLFCEEENEFIASPLITGFTLIDSSGSAYGWRTLSYRVADGSEGATFTHAAEDWAVRCMMMSRWSGVDTADPIASNATFDAGSWSSTVIPSVTTTVANAKLVMMTFTEKPTVSYSSGTFRYTGTIDRAVDDVGAEIWDETIASAGATGTRTGTFAGSDWYRGALVALAPVAEVGGAVARSPHGLFLPV